MSIARSRLSDLLNKKFPEATFEWIGSDVINERQRFAIDYENIDEKSVRDFVKTIIPNDEVYYFSKEDKKRYLHP